MSVFELVVITYVILAIPFMSKTLDIYQTEKPWYTWTGKYSLTQAYLIGLVLVILLTFFGWWYVATRQIMIYANDRITRSSND